MVTLRRRLVEFVVQEQRAGAALLIWATAHMIAFFEQLGAHSGRFDPKIIRSAVNNLWQGLAPGQPLTVPPAFLNAAD